MIGERLAMVETRVENIAVRLDSLQVDMREIRDSISKQRGFVAGFSAAFAFLWSAIIGLVAYIIRGLAT